MSRQSRAWTELSARYREACRQIDAPCALCGQPIDYTLSGRNRYGFTSDHIETIATGGAVLPGFDGLRPAHQKCNAARGDGTRARNIAAWGW